MNHYRIYLLIALLFFLPVRQYAQLIITQHPDAQALAQRLVGDGVSISNVSFTGNPLMAGFFLNRANQTQIGIESGIVLTTGRAKTAGSEAGVDGDGTTTAINVDANGTWGLPGDADLSAAIGNFNLEDACVLEFDFVPLGDSIKFNYVFSSEEYNPAYVCQFNDVFAFFISGPGITGLKNIALIPNTNTPVTIFNVNNVPNGACPNNPQYYINNVSSRYFTHDGHTTVFTAKEKVQPCQVYHLKLVLADAGDDNFDTGVFLQARSLVSNAFGITNLTQTDPGGNSYLVEGCATGAFNITRPRKDPFPLSISLSYGGTVDPLNDLLPMPFNVTIPADDSVVTVNVVPLIDNAPEGIEWLKVYALAGCAAGTPTDSTLIQLRDYDILNLSPDTARVCPGNTVQLTATAGYSHYQWSSDPTLNNLQIPNPVATPVQPVTTYICTATEGTCRAQDSVYVMMKKAEFLSKTDVNCRNLRTGTLEVFAGSGWTPPVLYSLDGFNWQNSNRFSGLAAGSYWVKVKDAACTDSILISIVQAYPDLLVSSNVIAPAGCSGLPDGQLMLTGQGGKMPYQYSADGISYQSSGLFNLNQGSYSFSVRDDNGCLNTITAEIPLNNTVTVDAGPETAICEGSSLRLQASSNAAAVSWSPAATLDNPSILTPLAAPADSTWYYISATTGICNRKDSVRINVWPAPVADAGPDIADCFGKLLRLQGAGGFTYSWAPATYFTGSSTVADPEFKASADISYYLTVTDGRGCSSLQPDEVKVKVTPAVKVSAGADTVAAINQPVQLQATELSQAGVTEWSWSGAQYLSNPAIANPVATLPAETRFTVTGKTADGCEGRDDILIKVYKGPDIYIPTGFTPDGNGLNDELKAFPVGIREFRFFRIFNRWGQQVFQTKDPGKGWDGRINGIVQPTGTFIWMAEAVDYQGHLISRKGVVTLIR